MVPQSYILVIYEKGTIAIYRLVGNNVQTVISVKLIIKMVETKPYSSYTKVPIIEAHVLRGNEGR